MTGDVNIELQKRDPKKNRRKKKLYLMWPSIIDAIDGDAPASTVTFTCADLREMPVHIRRYQKERTTT
jgi:hypothetical protein